ncbi:hypothetical protein CHLRE_03g146287v5 [Chlamydomonas reinhardtii]|uniref:Serine aminopeptidase S33 domain-containing protein n=1 Tax=Chlamydomonas reinhardtii TaxID=3055 RepID=A0A2K3DVF0_CHLRE|nr:uncharacterized protein CHLRE_03g146287v5 [Chlamydomonas reinhardtii]PNW84511.1 hypothetical protein CHLRE_03g146287v5 [Chlamydomonas reinhardtii]
MPRFYGHPLGGLQPSKSGYVEVVDMGGARLYWEEYGAASGRPLFAILGATTKIPSMGHFVQVAVERGYRVLLYESRGIGRSSCNAVGRQTTTLLAADAQAVLDGAWGTDSRFALFGISMGGMVAQELLYRLVAAGQKSRILAASLHVTSPGSWLRVPSFLHLPLMMMAFKPPTPAPASSAVPAAGNAPTSGKPGAAKKGGGGGAMFTDDADFAARYSLDTVFGKAWLDGPAPPEATDPAAIGVNPATAIATPVVGAAAIAKPPELAAAGDGAGGAVQLHVNAGAGGDAAAANGGSGSAVLTRREAVWRVFTVHWRETLALHAPNDYPAVACHVTAVLSHYLQPHRAAAIRAAGLRISVGVSTADPFFPEAAQRQLATALGAAVVQVVGTGHLDGAMLDGVYGAFDGALGWLLDTASKQEASAGGAGR